MRAQGLAQQRQQRISAAQAKEQPCSFQPKISNRSERIVQKRREDLCSSDPATGVKFLGPVEERLYAHARAKQQFEEFSETSSELLSTQVMDDASRRICEGSIYFQGSQADFLVRQQTFEMARQKRLEVRCNHEQQNCTFKPEISERSRQLVTHNIDHVGELPEERVHRLAVKDVERREQMLGELRKVYARECTFKPEISLVSRLLATTNPDPLGPGGGAPVHERLYRVAQDQRSKSVGDPRRSAAGSEECTFKPSVDESKRFSHVRGHYTGDGEQVMQRIREEQSRKEQLIQERRRQLELERKSECTFAPGTHKPFKESAKPVVVSGLDRFFELRELAAKQNKDQNDREAKAFNLKTSSIARCNGVTIPEPFHLSQACADEARLTKKRQGWNCEEQECTFVPRTTETLNQELLQELMRSTVAH